jgi:hypothetical protein
MIFSSKKTGKFFISQSLIWSLVILGLAYIKVNDLFLLRSFYLPGICPQGMPCSLPTYKSYLDFLSIWLTPTLLIASIIYTIIFLSGDRNKEQK